MGRIVKCDNIHSKLSCSTRHLAKLKHFYIDFIVTNGRYLNFEHHHVGVQAKPLERITVPKTALVESSMDHSLLNFRASFLYLFICF